MRTVASWLDGAPGEALGDLGDDAEVVVDAGSTVNLLGGRLQFENEPPVGSSSWLALRGVPRADVNGETPTSYIGRYVGSEELEARFGGDQHWIATTQSGQSIVVRQLGRFQWDLNAGWRTDHWFDDQAVLVAVEQESCSRSGLTADATAVVAYRQHVEVRAFREDIGEQPQLPKVGVIHAGTDYGKNPVPFVRPGAWAGWTGYAVSEHAIGDELARIIQLELGELRVAPTVCRHLPTVSVVVLATNPRDLPRFLCTWCRLRGTRMEEFLERNVSDVCPYFRRLAEAVLKMRPGTRNAAKQVVAASPDALPAWFQWTSRRTKLIGSFLRLREGDWSVYELTLVVSTDGDIRGATPKGFVRRAVLRLNDRTREVWTYPHQRENGFIPRSIEAFLVKYGEGTLMQGFMGVKIRHGEHSLTESELIAFIDRAFSCPIWVSDDRTVGLVGGAPVWSGLDGVAEALQPLVIQRGLVAGVELVPLTSSGEVDPNPPVVANPQPFYQDAAGNRYYLLQAGQPWVGGLELQVGSVVVKRLASGIDGKFYLLRVGAQIPAEVPRWERHNDAVGIACKAVLTASWGQDVREFQLTVGGLESTTFCKNEAEFQLGSGRSGDDQFPLTSTTWYIGCPDEEHRQLLADMLRARADVYCSGNREVPIRLVADRMIPLW